MEMLHTYQLKNYHCGMIKLVLICVCLVMSLTYFCALLVTYLHVRLMLMHFNVAWG